MDDIDRFLKEDLGEDGDITSDALFTMETGEAKLIAKEDCILAGLAEVELVFQKTDAKVLLQSHDGDFVKKGTCIGIITGSLRSILKGERLALNFLGRMSGIATATKKLGDQCQGINPKVKIAATRKTTPGFRTFEKKAVCIGGGDPHRFGLFDAFLIKDNHLKACGSMEQAIQYVNKKNTLGKIVEIEVETKEQAVAAAHLQVDVIMLDNFNPESSEEVAAEIRKINPSILIEVSGGITEDNILQYASFADRISMGCLTHSIKSVDFSLELQ